MVDDTQIENYPVIEFMDAHGQDIHGRHYGFGYFWLKYINGFDLSNHCAKSFIGNYSRHAWSDKQHAENAPLNEYAPPKFFYLCGVAVPYNWSINFHCAFRFKAGSVIDIDENGVQFRVRNAERMPINPVNESLDIPHIDEKSYNTCRNWQFAVEHSGITHKRVTLSDYF